MTVELPWPWPWRGAVGGARAVRTEKPAWFSLVFGQLSGPRGRWAWCALSDSIPRPSALPRGDGDKRKEKLDRIGRMSGRIGSGQYRSRDVLA